MHVMRVRHAEEGRRRLRRRLRSLSAAAAAVALGVVRGRCGGGLGSLVAEEGERALRTPVREVAVLAALQPYMGKVLRMVVTQQNYLQQLYVTEKA